MKRKYGMIAQLHLKVPGSPTVQPDLENLGDKHGIVSNIRVIFHIAANIPCLFGDLPGLLDVHAQVAFSHPDVCDKIIPGNGMEQILRYNHNETCQDDYRCHRKIEPFSCQDILQPKHEIGGKDAVPRQPDRP